MATPGGTGWPQHKRYRSELKGKPVDDIWLDIDRINPKARERLGYPTQKPEALLERIIEASSKKGDVVLDPFCGCGTTIAVAERLQRRWIGVDISPTAIEIMRRRLAKLGCRPKIGNPVDSLAALKGSSRLSFRTG
jgi:DNA modification methylase